MITPSPRPAPLAPVGILGAGFLGGPLAAALAPRPVLATTRSGAVTTWPEGQPSHVRVAPLDLLHADSPAIAAAFADARALVLCYAAGPRQDRRALYLEGTRRALEAAARLDLRRLVFTGSTSALPDHDGWLDETCERWPDDERGRIQREAEALVIDACDRARIPWIILRLAGLYGPGRGLGRLYRRDPAAPLAGDGMQATNLIHRDDAIAAACAALDAPSELSALIHVCDDDHRPRRDLFDLVAAAEGLPAPRWELPPGPAIVGKRVVNRRLKELLGVRLRHPEHVLT